MVWSWGLGCERTANQLQISRVEREIKQVKDREEKLEKGEEKGVKHGSNKVFWSIQMLSFQQSLTASRQAAIFYSCNVSMSLILWTTLKKGI